ncbi:MAG: hypothetical protein GVY19_14030 [Bacteroidetes bacterium]|jgi:polysaccharide export outer membrane protein|nr:hypothetical protein [Bacteroidota bacterium]
MKNITQKYSLSLFGRLPMPIFILLFLFSCSAKRINYLQEAKDDHAAIDSLYQESYETYRVQPADILHVQVNSLNEETNVLFNQNTDQSSGNQNLGGFYIRGYSISEAGYIDLPIMGEIKVADMTVAEIEKRINEAAEAYIKEPDIDVKLVSFDVTILGEVNSPGRITVYRDKMNILDVMGMAGDISYYGNRREVRVVRTTKEGRYTYELDLTDKNLLASSDFYVAPNDIIYVKPTPIGIFRVRASDYSTLLTTITSTITAVVLIVTLTQD